MFGYRYFFVFEGGRIGDIGISGVRVSCMLEANWWFAGFVGVVVVVVDM